MKNITKLLCLSLLAILPQFAYADFRKALDALQHIDGIAMMLEVEDAIKTKNNDGLSLFLPTLSARYKWGAFYIGKRTDINSRINDGGVHDTILLNKDYIPELIGYLEKAVELSGDKDDQEALNYLKRQIAYVPTKPNPQNNVAPTKIEWEKLASEGNVGAVHQLASNTIFNAKQADANNITWVKKSASMGCKDSVLWLASLYLQDNYFNKDMYPTIDNSLVLYRQVISPDDKEGMYWLKKAAIPPSANPNAACKIADAYYKGEKLTKNIREAYLWYIEANPKFNDCSAKGLHAMADANDLAQLNPELSNALKKNDPKILYELFWKVMQNTERPTDIKLALKEQVKANSATPQPVYSVEDNNYQLYLFADGKVQYRSRGGYITGKDEWKIPKEKVKQFLTALEKTSIYYGRNEVESVACDMGERWRYGKIVTIKDKQPYLVEYTTVRHAFYNPITAKIFKVQETFIPTQHLRCGSSKEDIDYKNCVTEDRITFENADRANNFK